MIILENKNIIRKEVKNGRRSKQRRREKGRSSK
jgi:hypothetical protein